ncbi:MAG TPA: hypothetical protein VG498_10785 [Terriglobales bacterium]|nr:hypothetical protein [Terriglobales bacterium]
MKHYSSNPLAHLYRKKKNFVCAALLLVVAAGFLQPSMLRAQRKKETGPRALAVVTWNGDDPSPTPGTSVLTPVAIRVEGRFYDAELYQAQPEPLAVQSGVVYDVLKSGEVVGTFTVGAPRERDSVWYGTGAFEKKGAKEQAAKAASPKPAAPAEPEDERPRLRRGAPPPPAPKEQTDEVLNNIDRDPERPTLRRHTAEERKAQSSVPVKEFVPPEMHMMVAVSDAGGPEPRPFTFRSKPGEVEQLRGSMEKLARAELEKTRKPADAPRPKAVARSKGRTSGPVRAAIDLQNGKVGIFDVNSNNAPILVYSATAMVDGTKKYITVAAWEEIDQSLRKVFAQITDDQHLDVYPRLEVIDAVDASGNGRGELLFRAFGDQGSRFLLYHPGPDSLNLLFDSARG